MGHRNITRTDFGRTHGWWVRIYRTDAAGHKGCTNQLFSDGVHGGKRKALKAALAWRDEILGLLPAKKVGGGAHVPPGYGYVKREVIKRRVGYAPVYRAWIRLEDGRPACTSRSIAVWGVTGARVECVKWIQEQRRGIRERSMLAPHRFPPVVVRTVRGATRL